MANNWSGTTIGDGENMRPIAATDYGLIGLAPGDVSVVTTRTPAVNLYEAGLSPFFDYESERSR
jgi:hypothetical protein